MHYYAAVLPILKKYVCLFQTKEPRIHRQNDQQIQVFSDFLACFVKPQIIMDKSARQLKELDLGNTELLLKKKDMFYGHVVDTMAQGIRRDYTVLCEFTDNVVKAYAACGKYMQFKLPLNNPVLKAISAIDPIARGNDVTSRHMKQLPKLVTNVLGADEIAALSSEVHGYQVDRCLPLAEDTFGCPVRVDRWWAKVNEHYPHCQRWHVQY